MRLLSALAALLFSFLAIVPLAAADRAILVLDGSGSMWAQIDGVSRIEIARETLGGLLGSLPDDLELGLMSYGHRTRGDCADIELLVEPGAGTAEAIGAAANAINPRGKTPLSDAVRQAAEALRFTEDKATVILVTDGIETCAADPCALGADLEAQGIDFTAHVVGFGLSDAEGQQVACLAYNTGGQYLEARDATGLGEALSTAVAQVEQPSPVTEPAPEPVAAPDYNFAPLLVLAEGDDPLPDNIDGVTWEIHPLDAAGNRTGEVRYEYGARYRGTLEPSSYAIVAKLGEAATEQTVAATADEVAEPFFTLNAGTIIARPRAAEGQPVSDGAALAITLPDGRTTTYYGENTIVLPAGSIPFEVTIGAGVLREDVAIPAGEVIERDFVLGVGRAIVNAYYVEGTRVEDGGLYVQIFGAAKAIDGSRQQFSYGYGPASSHDLPAGDYVALIDMDATEVETPFTVTSGQLVEISSVLNAGVVAITAPAFDYLQLVTRPDIAGNRKQFGYGYGGTLQGTVPAGEYIVLAEPRGGGTVKEVPAVVRAGERTEVTVEP